MTDKFVPNQTEGELTAHNPEIPHWDERPDDLKPVLARQMEVYAGFLEHTDAQVGVLVDALEEQGVLLGALVIKLVVTGLATLGIITLSSGH